MKLASSHNFRLLYVKLIFDAEHYENQTEQFVDHA